MHCCHCHNDCIVIVAIVVSIMVMITSLMSSTTTTNLRNIVFRVYADQKMFQNKAGAFELENMKLFVNYIIRKTSGIIFVCKGGLS